MHSSWDQNNVWNRAGCLFDFSRAAAGAADGFSLGGVGHVATCGSSLVGQAWPQTAACALLDGPASSFGARTNPPPTPPDEPKGKKTSSSRQSRSSQPMLRWAET